MLTAIRCSDSERLLAWDTARGEQPFACPACGEVVILKRGRIRMAHFAHKPPVTCSFGAGETEDHRRCKQALYEGLLRHVGVEAVELEFPVGAQRADVYAVIRGMRVAFEVQVSTLTPDALEARTRGYARQGVSVCWMHPYTFDGISEGLNDGKYAPKQWERWIHAANFGRCYYWTEELWVQPVHFERHRLEVELRTWHSSDGEELSAGGYSRVSRRYRTPVAGDVAHLVRDFLPKARAPFVTDRMNIPSCTIYSDQQRPWWSR